MKTIFPLVVATALWSPSLNAQVSLPPMTAGPVSVDAGPHHRTWQTVKVQLDERSHQVTTTNSYVELATGMNVWSETEGKWVAASDEIELVKGGAVAARTQQKLVFLPNLNDGQPPISLFLPDGRPLRSKIVGLAYTERDTGKSVFISELKDSIGQVVGRNQVVYPDAFETIKADVRYTVTQCYFEQDVILREQIPAPAEMGLNPKTARLEVWTEFFDGPEPEKSTGAILRNDGATDSDVSLNFGSMQMIGGKSFSLDGEMTAGGLEPLRDNGFQNAKEWQVIEGRTFLIESVPHSDLLPALDALPAARVAWKMDAKSRERLAANTQPGKRHKPISVAQSVPAPSPMPSISDPAQMVATAKAPAPQPGVLLDYILINSTQTNFVFQGDTTYYATNYVLLYGTTVLEGGAVAKGIQYDGGPYTGTFIVHDAFDCRTSPYRPAIFTAADDDTVGDLIAASTGIPTNLYRGSLWFDTTNSVVLENVHVRYAVTGCSIKTVTNPLLSNMQLLHCYTALEKFRDNCSFRNILIDQSTVAIRGCSANLTAEHVTTDGTILFFQSTTNATYTTPSTMTVTNSLFVNVYSFGAFTGGPNATNSSASTTFQSVGASSHYLLPNSPYRNAGTTNISASLLAELKKLTTYPPIVLTNDFSVSTTLSPQAQRDTDTPDLGYHYWPLDWCWSGLNLNATLTLTNGVAVATYGTNGLALQSGARLVSEGLPMSMNHLVRYDAVQEQPIVWGATGSTMSLMTAVGTNPLPEVKLRFTDVSLLTDLNAKRHLVQLGGSRVGTLSVTDSQLRGVYANVYSTTGTGMTIGLTNNLVERSELSFYQTNTSGYYPFTLSLYNNLFLNSTVALNYRDNSTIWTVKDNLFDNVTLSEGTFTIANSNNAYKGTNQLAGGTNNKTLTTTDYKAGPLGNFYYPTSGTNLFTLIDVGSRSADQAGLYHYTTQTNQVKETNSVVDIGLHYVATDVNGNALDSDFDGLADYLEDRNGNGELDSGETSWMGPGLLIGLKLWLKGDAGVLTDSSTNISAWQDQSGNGNDATQAFSYRRPQYVTNVVNGKPVARYNSTALDLPNFASGFAEGEAFIVIKANSAFPAYPGLGFWYFGDANALTTYPANNGRIYDNFGTTRIYATGVPAQPVNQFHFYNVTSRPNEWSSRINGVTHHVETANTVAFTPTPKLFGESYGFVGDVAEVLVYNRGLGENDRDAVASYLNER